ncbi:MAG: FecR domain-containing protein [Sandaracinus sp.]|nr:FecR domain-containing protein [Sandaracinus sp.]MCB9622475.1 FecR domain-containing protein [Sandaracinus sp.]
MLEVERARDALREEVDEARVRRVWREIDGRRRRRTSTPWTFAVGTSLAAACAIAFFARPVDAPEPTPRVRTSVPASEPEPELLRLASDEPLPTRLVGDLALSDASHVRVRDDARLDLLESTSRRVGLALRSGRARFEITPGGPRAWHVDAGEVSVHVVGTVFEVTRGSEGVTVEVERGAVLVRGAAVPDRVQRLEAGERLFVPSAVVEAEPEAVAPPRRPVWRDRASDARYDEAFEALGPGGVAAVARRTHDADELWALVDVARHSGHAADAVEPLRRLVERAPNDSRAALAAYTLGRLELEVLDQPDEAAMHLARSLDLGLPRALREPASARRVEALGRAGRTGEAQAEAARHLERHPEGARAEEVRRWLAR